MSRMPPFTIEGVTIHGKRLGTELGFPTANLDYPPATDLPPDGVYVAEAILGDRRYPAILNQGRHPTAPGGRATIETHLLGFAGGDLYGQRLTLCYLRYLRPEKRFDSLPALRAQLAADEAEAWRWVRRNVPALAGKAPPHAGDPEVAREAAVGASPGATGASSASPDAVPGITPDSQAGR